MPREKSPGKPTTRRYTDAEKDQAVRLVRQLRDEFGTELSSRSSRCYSPHKTRDDLWLRPRW